jgi:hypothetical protein
MNVACLVGLMLLQSQVAPPNGKEPTRVTVEIGGKVSCLKGCDAWPKRKKMPRSLELVYALPKGNYEIQIQMPNEKHVVIHARDVSLIQDQGEIIHMGWIDTTNHELPKALDEAKETLKTFGVERQSKVAARLESIKKAAPKKTTLIRGLLSYRVTLDLGFSPHIDCPIDEVKGWSFNYSIDYHSIESWKEVRDIDEAVWKALTPAK